jgi:geranylgeranyl diphosphate synthase type I
MMQANINQFIKRVISSHIARFPDDYRAMIEYQMGLDGNLLDEKTQGKRLRPLFVLLACDLFGTDWHLALPAAAGIELLHNFSLVHDDIQDGSETRRGRESVWKVWGIPQAINTGDGLLNLAYLSIKEFNTEISSNITNLVLFKLQKTCLELTEGQHLDMAFEKKTYIPLDLYWKMIEGKTANLISACFEIGAIIAGAPGEGLQEIKKAGRNLGLAFQVQDDFLGIWGNEFQTGKSTLTDLLSRKKTYPVVLGIENKKKFAELWKLYKSVDRKNAEEMADDLAEEGIKELVIAKYKSFYEDARLGFKKLANKGRKINHVMDLIGELENRTR